MLIENNVERDQMEFFCIDSFVPQAHLLRKIEECLLTIVEFKMSDHCMKYAVCLFCQPHQELTK